MPEPEEKKESPPPFPLHKHLPGMIRETVTNLDLAGFITLVKLAEKIRIPENHDEISKTIDDGVEHLTAWLQHASTMAVVKLQQEAIAKLEKEMEEVEAETPARRIINQTTPGPAFTDDPLPETSRDESELELQIAAESGKTREMEEPGPAFPDTPFPGPPVAVIEALIKREADDDASHPNCPD